MRLRPVALLNHGVVVFPSTTTSQSAQDAATRRAYLYLVTMHGVAPDTAKKLLKTA